MEDIFHSCQHYVVLAHDQELALSEVLQFQLWLLSVNHRRMHSATQHSKTRKFRSVGCFSCSFLMPKWEMTLESHWKTPGARVFPQRFVLSTTASLRIYPINTGTVCEESHVWPFKSARRADPFRIHPQDSSHADRP